MPAPDKHSISGVMVSVFASSVVGREFEPRLGQSKDNKIIICCLLTKHTTILHSTTVHRHACIIRQSDIIQGKIYFAVLYLLIV